MSDPAPTPTPPPLDVLLASEGVASGFAAARDGIDALLRDRGLRRTTAAQTTEALLIGAHASAVLEGSETTLAQLRSGAADATAQAAARLGGELLALVPVLERSPLQALARLHTIAAAGSLDQADLGRPVSGAAASALHRVRDLLARSGSAPALLIAALVHAELVTAQPFASRNGLVARAAERLVLVSRGVDPTSVLVPEGAHLKLRAAYESNLRGYREGGSSGVHAWLLYAAEAYAKAAELSPLNG